MHKGSILVVDDEKNIIDLVCFNLEKEGYKVFSAETGEEGLELARTARPSAVILDLMLPHMDGLEVCRALKRSPDTKKIPVLMLTARNSEVDQVTGLELGAADYLTKPFSPKVLLARLKNVIKTGLPVLEEKNRLSQGPFELDRDRHMFTVRGKTVPLTKKEFEIAALLIEQGHRVIPRDELVTRIWGHGAVVSAASLNMHIKSLREKLKNHRNCLETIRGVGFRFAETLA